MSEGFEQYDMFLSVGLRIFWYVGREMKPGMAAMLYKGIHFLDIITQIAIFCIVNKHSIEVDRYVVYPAIG